MSTASPRAPAVAEHPHRRVILLLDMDCFYAQCETVRLGLDPSLPLALLQWNSALAVNYPARAFGIRRGDAYAAIREKSSGRCVALHLPVRPVEEGSPAAAPTPGTSPCPEADGAGDDDGAPSQRDGADVDSTLAAYAKEFHQPAEVREAMYRREKNRMRSPSEGKACLDRYRLASSRIFSLIDATLAEHLGRKNFTLERASIDELFIDVTAFCYRPNDSDAGADNEEGDSAATLQFRADCDANARQSLRETRVCHPALVEAADGNDEAGVALRLGCHIALAARRAVREELGFTLSAGVSTSKLVSKLAASYGKPNGQAVIFPGRAMTEVMNETPLRKARMLGGKLGKKVQALLPDSETTLGSISRLMPLSCLVTSIGEDSGRWVFDACRGIDYEEVRATLKVLPKSITAFKSFQKISYPEADKWTKLLARDVMTRVEADSARHQRIPKSVTVGYTIVPGGAWIGKTFRLPFPTGDFHARVQKLVDQTRKRITERGHASFVRLGLSAVDFVVRPKVGIDSFFGKRTVPTSPATHPASGHAAVQKETHAKLVPLKSVGIDSFFSSSQSQPANQIPGANMSPDPVDHRSGASQGTKSTPFVETDEKDTSLAKEKDAHQSLGDAVIVTSMNSNANLTEPAAMTDEEMARRLQESYDAEATERGRPHAVPDGDQTLASQLQSSYDREHSVLSHVERFSAKRNGQAQTLSRTKALNSKRSKMDFFLKK